MCADEMRKLFRGRYYDISCSSAMQSDNGRAEPAGACQGLHGSGRSQKRQ